MGQTKEQSPKNAVDRFVAKIEAWLMSEPNENWTRVRCLVVSFVVVAVCLYALARTQLFSYRDPGITSSDLVLSGTWKYKLEDSPAFSNLKLDDSSWCLIQVPDAGLEPVPSSGDHPATSCPTERYPRAEMRGKTYWYRYRFEISSSRSWKDPALFLGAIKDQSWIFLDGKQIGTTRFEMSPSVVPLDSTLVPMGVHELAIRVHTGESLNPGIFHSYLKQVSLGELKDNLLQGKRLVRDQQELAVVAVVQFLALFVLSFFIFRTGGVGEQFFWLLIYFGSASLMSASPLIASRFQRTAESVGFIGLSTAVAGYGNHILGRNRAHRFFGNRIILGIGFGSFLVQLCFLKTKSFDTVTVILSLVYVSGFGLTEWIWKRWFSKSESRPYSITETFTLLVLLCLHGVHFFDRVLDADHAVFIHPPLVTAILTGVVVILAAEEYIRQVQSLAFFGRFIRPGLKQLVWDFRHKPEKRHDWVRGRKIPLFKVDIIGFTDSTYKMPYGLKRLYQDLWCVHVDRVLEEISFFDQWEGDGSIYCITDRCPEGSCKATIAAAEKIESEAIPAFDHEFRDKLHRLYDSTPQLQEPFEQFLDRYRKKNGANFSDLRTSVRLIFHYSWVDEGLWGLKTKSHYSVTGDSLIELCRLEKLAAPREYLMTKDFLDQWTKEDKTIHEHYEFEFKTASLKGVGDFEYVIAKRKPSLIKAVA